MLRLGESIGLAIHDSALPRLSSFPSFTTHPPDRCAGQTSVKDVVSRCFGPANAPDCSSRDEQNYLKRLSPGRLTLPGCQVYKIKIRIFILEHDPFTPPPGFDPRVIPVSPSSFFQYCKRSWLLQERCRLDSAFLFPSCQAEENEPGSCSLSRLPVFTMSYISEQTTHVSRSFILM